MTMAASNYEFSPDLISEIFLNACRTGDLDHFTKLLHQGVDPNSEIPYKDATQPLIYVAMIENEDVVKLLLEHGAHVNSMRFRGTSKPAIPLQIATVHGKLVSIKHLLNHGADITLKNSVGQCSIHTIASLTSVDVYSLVHIGKQAAEKMALVARTLKNDWKTIFQIMMDHGLTNLKSGSYRKFFEFLKVVRESDDIGEVTKALDNVDSDILRFVEYLQPEPFFNLVINRPEVAMVFFEKNMYVLDVLKSAFLNDNTAILDLFLEGYYDLMDENRWTRMLRMAIDVNSLQTVLRMVQDFDVPVKDADLAMLVTNCSSGIFPLAHPGVQREILDFLLSRRPIDLTGYTTGSLLHNCVDDGACEIYALILEHGAEVEVGNKNKSSVHWCSRGTDCEVFRFYQKINILDSFFAESKVFRVLPNLGTQVWRECKKLNNESYRDEANNLRNLSISCVTPNYPKISMYYFMFLSLDSAIRYVNSESLNRLYQANDEDFRKIYPHYGFILNYQYRRAKRPPADRGKIVWPFTYNGGIRIAELIAPTANKVREPANDCGSISLFLR